MSYFRIKVNSQILIHITLSMQGERSIIWKLSKMYFPIFLKMRMLDETEKLRISALQKL